VDRGVHKNGIGPFGSKTVGLSPAMNRTTVHNPEDPMGGAAGRWADDLTDEAIHGSDAIFDFAATEDFGAMDVPRCQVGPGAFAEVLMLNSHGAGGSRGQSRQFAAPGLNAGLFIRRLGNKNRESMRRQI